MSEQVATNEPTPSPKEIPFTTEHEAMLHRAVHAVEMIAKKLEEIAAVAGPVIEAVKANPMLGRFLGL